jgi:uncharacterized protein YndB with AHSA1/START domain
VRYADHPTAEVEVYVDAPPARVWPLVTDVGLPARFSPELVSATWADDAPGPAVGARIVGRSRHPAIGEWETTSTVVACEPERVFGWAVGDPEQPAATWRFELAAEGSGTRLRQWVQVGPGRSGLTGAIEARPDKEERIVAARLGEWRAGMTATLTGIKELAEAGPG